MVEFSLEMCQTNELIENGLHNRKSVLSRFLVSSFPLARHRFLISASRIHFEAKKVLFTKGSLFAYQFVENRVKKKKFREENRLTHDLFLNYLVPLSSWLRAGIDSVPKLSDLSETKDRDNFYSKEYVTHETYREINGTAFYWL